MTIAANGVQLRGLGAKPEDVVLTFGNSHAMAGGTTKSASTTISGDDFYAENLTFDNSFSRDQPDAHGDTQAVALLTLGDRQVYRHVRLIGAQDTLYANSKVCHSTEDATAAQPCRAARQYFSDCYIEGHVDFIFGDAKAVFDHCEIARDRSPHHDDHGAEPALCGGGLRIPVPRLFRDGCSRRDEYPARPAMANAMVTRR